MVRVESGITILSEQHYAAILAELERKRQEILNPSQASDSLPLWKKFFRTKPKEKIALSSKEQLAQLEAEFKSKIFSNRQLVVFHLKANPNKQEEIIADYLQSPELLKDTNTLGQFLTFWLLEFFQKANTGPIDKLLNFIKNSAPRLLPSELHQARSEIFEPLFKILSGKEREIFKNINEQANISDVSQKLAEALIEINQPLPDNFKKAYQKYVDTLIKIEAGIISVGPAEPEPKKLKKTKKVRSPVNSPPPSCPQNEPKEVNQISSSFYMVVGSKKLLIENLEQLKETIRKEKINDLGSVSPELIWKNLLKIASTPPPLLSLRYRKRVKKGPTKGWLVKGLGRKCRLVFNKTKTNKLLFKVGDHETVYGDNLRRKPKDYRPCH